MNKKQRIVDITKKGVKEIQKIIQDNPNWSVACWGETMNSMFLIFETQEEEAWLKYEE